MTQAHSAPAPAGASALCKTYTWACSASAHPKDISRADFSKIDRVNRAVNHRVREVADIEQFRVEEHWSLPTSRGGDCEDFALLKKKKLIELGFAPQSLLIATALNKTREGHAVLIVRTTEGDLVLDNLTSRVKNWSETGYIFLRMQNPKAPRRWISLTAG